MIRIKSDLPIQSGNNVPARDSEYLLPVNIQKKVEKRNEKIAHYLSVSVCFF
jgi:hypothetical protein